MMYVGIMLFTIFEVASYVNLSGEKNLIKASLLQEHLIQHINICHGCLSTGCSKIK